MSVLRRATRRNIPEDDILHSRRRENLKSYIERSLSEGTASKMNEKSQFIMTVMVSELDLDTPVNSRDTSQSFG
jgi:hypothetical protein